MPWTTKLTRETAPVYKHICGKLCLYHNTDKEKKIIISFLKIENCKNLTKSPSPNEDAFCQVWLKLAMWFWRRNEKLKHR